MTIPNHVDPEIISNHEDPKAAKKDKARARQILQEEQAQLELIDERDRLEAMLDKFAYAVAPEAVIGEHSSANDPWANALEMVTSVADVDKLKTERGALNARVERALALLRVWRDECDLEPQTARFLYEVGAELTKP